tara:strand:- start:1072 stop:1383 length:312 start_codon:yes stop_codon:yes gene_type:complete
MKLNKDNLKQLIYEALLAEIEQDEKMTTASVTKHAVDQKKAMVQGGIDDKERSAIATVSRKLAMAAKAGNLLSGNLAIRLRNLIDEIDKTLKDVNTTQQGDKQ